MGVPGEPPGTRKGCHYGFNASLLTQHNAVSYAVIMKQKLPSIKKSLSMKPRLVKIYSENNDFQYIETLRRKREKRQRQREFFIEGVRPINQALKYDWTINAFVYSREKALSDWAKNILAHSQAKTHFEVPLPLLEKLSNKNEPSEILALVAMPEDDLGRIPVKDNMLVVVFDRPASPGNLGTIIRSWSSRERLPLVGVTRHPLAEPDGRVSRYPALPLRVAEDSLYQGAYQHAASDDMTYRG